MKRILLTLAVLAMLFVTANAFAQTTNFPNGFTNVGNNSSALHDLDIPFPAKTIVWFDDFMPSHDTVNGASDYDVTTAGLSAHSIHGMAALNAAGVILGGTIEPIGIAGGVLAVTNGAVDNNDWSLQTKDALIYPQSGKKTWFEARIMTGTSATECDMYIGLIAEDTTPDVQTDGMYYRFDEGDVNWDAQIEIDSTGTSSTAITTAATGTVYTLGIYYNGDDAVEFWINGVKYVDLDPANAPIGRALCPTLHLQNGEASYTNWLVDYIFAAQER